jgi:DNA topoisomerase I
MDRNRRKQSSRHANSGKLRYVSCGDAGILRVRRGKGFAYRLPNGKPLTDARELERIRGLALPPAWRDVWICVDPNGHLQATGFDARGRKQYRYATRWRAARDARKYSELLEFSEQLPRLRQRLSRDLGQSGLSRDKVLATMVSLMAQTGVRIGNERYTLDNGSFGLTTLLDRHANIKAGKLELSFRGKGGKPYRTRLEDGKLARIVRRCRDIPGQRLFQYLDARGHHQCIGSSDVNQYIKRLGAERFSAKTFRTWVATVAALSELRRIEPATSLSARKRQLNQAISNVADRLGNTLAICRKSYVHPALMSAFLADELPPAGRVKRAGLNKEESDLVAVLERAPRQRMAA